MKNVQQSVQHFGQREAGSIPSRVKFHRNFSSQKRITRSNGALHPLQSLRQCDDGAAAIGAGIFDVIILDVAAGQTPRPWRRSRGGAGGAFRISCSHSRPPARDLPPAADPGNKDNPNLSGGFIEALYDLARGATQDLAQFRAELGIPSGTGTLARLDVNGQSFYGINAHGQDVDLAVNPISATHAETDAFQQASNAGVVAGDATMYVDRDLCGACGDSGAVKSMGAQIGLDSLRVVTPSRTWFWKY
jgi:hypothetical protein